jgi:isobutyryl-CoA mutase
MTMSTRYQLQNPVRVVTAASLFDGHDASINIMRRVIQASGAEVIHLGHNRSVMDIVSAAIQEDAQAIAVSSYQGGHVLYFKYMRDLLVERGAGHIHIFGGGGGVIVREEIEELQAYGITRIYSPQDGTSLGLEGMIDDMLRSSDFDPAEMVLSHLKKGVVKMEPGAVARALTLCERRADGLEIPQQQAEELNQLLEAGAKSKVPVLGITGTGGAGKSSLTDEIIRRFLENYPDKRIGIISVDPTKRRTGGALLGDRIRMNSLDPDRCFMRSLATRHSGTELSAAATDALKVLQASACDLVVLETSGIGQGSSAIVDIVDFSLYVMTSEYGAASQLEKIDMIDYADMIVLNKFEKRGSIDALRDVRRQYRRARSVDWELPDSALPVYATIASRFDCNGTNWFFDRLMEALSKKTGSAFSHEALAGDDEIVQAQLIPGERISYLGDISTALRGYRNKVNAQAELLDRKAALEIARTEIASAELAGSLCSSSGDSSEAMEQLQSCVDSLSDKIAPETLKSLASFDETLQHYQGNEYRYTVRDKEFVQVLARESLSGNMIPRVALPRYTSRGDVYRFVALENLPGFFPYTAGVFPFKRQGEDPTRQFAGEGPPERTNRRFHLLSENAEAKRLSTAFDSVTLYGEDPDNRPDVYGKVGESGVSICTLDDMKRLFDGFDLSAASTSVSMTINGPAPMILAMYMNTAIDFAVDQFCEKEGREPNAKEREEIVHLTQTTVRGTVQADILKEDQAQNTCVFSTEFALKLMGDVQEWFIEKGVRNYYSVSISGYHIAEAGANPISQLAFTLANGFTYVEYYLARGMKIDDFAPNLSFFFSNGLDPEYAVIGRVARRIWAIAMRDIYGANERSQKLKYHIQTSGRSLHAQEMDFNDIRTTLQALLAIYDNCNSLHTNAYDEAVTTPTEESVRRALAIQLIVNHEFGMTKNENPLQGSFITDELTDLVEEAVLIEFERLSERGGVLGAMETQYQRGRIQEESMKYELRKESGELPIIGVNTFTTVGGSDVPDDIELARATDDEKRLQVERLLAFQKEHKEEAIVALERLMETARAGGNLFEELMKTVRVASLGQITNTLYQVGGQYRRNM